MRLGALLAASLLGDLLHPARPTLATRVYGLGEWRLTLQSEISHMQMRTCPVLGPTLTMFLEKLQQLELLKPMVAFAILIASPTSSRAADRQYEASRDGSTAWGGSSATSQGFVGPSSASDDGSIIRAITSGTLESNGPLEGYATRLQRIIPGLARIDTGVYRYNSDDIELQLSLLTARENNGYPVAVISVSWRDFRPKLCLDESAFKNRLADTNWKRTSWFAESHEENYTRQSSTLTYKANGWENNSCLSYLLITMRLAS